MSKPKLNEKDMRFNPPKRNLNEDEVEEVCWVIKGFNPPKRNLNQSEGELIERFRKCFNPPKRNLNLKKAYSNDFQTPRFNPPKRNLNGYIVTNCINILLFQSTKEEFKLAWGIKT